MTEKYIELEQRIADYEGLDVREKWAVGVALRWLDENPNQVPGRTITRRDFERAFDFHFDDEYIDRHERFLAYLGITVVPDTEPTNAELLAEALRQTNPAHGSDLHDIKGLSEALDKAGVKAPGGDDDH